MQQFRIQKKKKKRSTQYFFFFFFFLLMRIPVIIGLCLFLIVMGILGFTPIQLRVNDKILHFTVFFVLSIFLYFLWNMSIRRNLILATTSFLVFAVGSELIQGTLPVTKIMRYIYNIKWVSVYKKYRSFDTHDILANLTGGALGIPISCLTDYWRKIKIKEYEKVVTSEEEEIMIDTLY